ncbi:MAG TPA: hypothetical protein VNM16_11685 [Bacillota bacterium]|nr:hypothetical protein [Bacillota bacterium]
MSVEGDSQVDPQVPALLDRDPLHQEAHDPLALLEVSVLQPVAQRAREGLQRGDDLGLVRPAIPRLAECRQPALQCLALCPAGVHPRLQGGEVDGLRGVGVLPAALLAVDRLEIGLDLPDVRLVAALLILGEPPPVLLGERIRLQQVEARLPDGALGRVRVQVAGAAAHALRAGVVRVDGAAVVIPRPLAVAAADHLADVGAAALVAAHQPAEQVLVAGVVARRELGVGRDLCLRAAEGVLVHDRGAGDGHPLLRGQGLPRRLLAVALAHRLELRRGSAASFLP